MSTQTEPIYYTTLPTRANGERGSLQQGLRGALHVQLMAADGTAGTLVSNSIVDAGSNANSLVFALARLEVFNGTTWDRLRAVSIAKTKADASVTAATGATVWTPASGKKCRIIRGQLSLSVAGQIILLDNAIGGTELLRSPQLAAGGIWEFDVGNGLILAAANNVVKLDVSSTGNVGGWIGGTEE